MMSTFPIGSRVGENLFHRASNQLNQKPFQAHTRLTEGKNDISALFNEARLPQTPPGRLLMLDNYHYTPGTTPYTMSHGDLTSFVASLNPNIQVTQLDYRETPVESPNLTPMENLKHSLLVDIRENTDELSEIINNAKSLNEPVVINRSFGRPLAIVYRHVFNALYPDRTFPNDAESWTGNFDLELFSNLAPEEYEAVHKAVQDLLNDPEIQQARTEAGNLVRNMPANVLIVAGAGPSIQANEKEHLGYEDLYFPKGIESENNFILVGGANDENLTSSLNSRRTQSENRPSETTASNSEIQVNDSWRLPNHPVNTSLTRFYARSSSFYAPVVATAALRVWQTAREHNPNFSASDVEALLKQTAESPAGANPENIHMLNYNAAMDAANNTPNRSSHR